MGCNIKKRILLLSLLLIILSFSSLYVYAIDNNLNVNMTEVDTFFLLHDRIIGAVIVFFVVLFYGLFLFVILLKPEPRVVSINLADRYKQVSRDELENIGINIDEFKLMIYKKFREIHIAFSNSDYDNLRLNLTNDLYKYYTFEIDELKKKNQKNIMRDFEFVNFKIYKINNVHGKIRLDIYLNVRMLDYVIDMNNDTVVRGNIAEKMEFEFELIFVKNVTGKKMYDKYVMSKKTCVNVMPIQKNVENKK